MRVRVPPIPPEISKGDEDLNTQFVLVRHPDQQMLRWFCVPYDLSSEITVPGIVLYETERGYDFGFVDGAMLIDENRASTFLTMISGAPSSNNLFNLLFLFITLLYKSFKSDVANLPPSN